MLIKYHDLQWEGKFMKHSIRRIVVFIVLLCILILDVINISNIINIPINNVNLDFWNIVVVVVLYALTYEIVDKRDNKRKKNQEEIAKKILETTYKECQDYIELIDSKLFKEVCPKRFPGDQTMENNSAYHNLREAPFEQDSIIYTLGQEGIISASELQNYINVKDKYHVYFSNVVCFPDQDEITDPIKSDLKRAVNNAVSELKK